MRASPGVFCRSISDNPQLSGGYPSQYLWPGLGRQVLALLRRDPAQAEGYRLVANSKSLPDDGPVDRLVDVEIDPVSDDLTMRGDAPSAPCLKFRIADTKQK